MLGVFLRSPSTHSASHKVSSLRASSARSSKSESFKTPAWSSNQQVIQWCVESRKMIYKI